MTKLVEVLKFHQAAPPKDYTSAAMTAEYVSFKLYKHLTIVIESGAWQAGTSAVSLLQATNVTNSLSDAKALGMAYMWTDIAAAGTLVKTAVTSDTFNVGTANSQWVIEIDAAELDVDNGFDCVTLVMATPGANADLYSVLYIMSEPRYAGSTPPSAIIN